MTLRANYRASTSAPNEADAVLRAVPLWKQFAAFSFGFFIQWNILIGGSGEGAAAVGGYGFRITDFLSVIGLALLGIHALSPRRVLASALFGLIVAVLIVPRILNSSVDPRTLILLEHYALYSFAGLYIAVLLSDSVACDRFCWGLIAGLLATIPIFVLQANEFTSALIDLGLVPAYYRILQITFAAASRYAGLWGHPNEASHVAALAAAAGAYFTVAYRRLLPLIIVAAAFVVIFWYTQSRGGFLAAGLTLCISVLVARQKGTKILPPLLPAILLIIGIIFALQIDFIASRLVYDPGTATNYEERTASLVAGLNIVLANPFGLPMTEFEALMRSDTGGIATPHNGFVFFAAVFGVVPFAILIAAFVANLKTKDTTDVFFAFFSLQIGISMLFEEVPLSYCYALSLCMILGRAYLKTPIGRILTT